MSNYSKGVAYERKAKKELEALGYQVTRAAGSHGPWDLIAIPPKGRVRCIQIKRTTSPLGVSLLMRKFKPSHTDEDNYVHELWVWCKARWNKSVDIPLNQ